MRINSVHTKCTKNNDSILCFTCTIFESKQFRQKQLINSQNNNLPINKKASASASEATQIFSGIFLRLIESRS